jgi:hypothetical protein
MTSWGDRFNQLSGRTRIVVCRLFIHLAGREVAPLLGLLNRVAYQAVEAGDQVAGDLTLLGAGLVDVCQALLQYDTYWQSAANEGDVFWDEGEAGDYVTELFTDSAQRYGSGLDVDDLANPGDPDEPLAIPITQHVIVMLTIAYEGQIPQLEGNLGDINALRTALTAIINLYHNGVLRAIEIHYSPTQLGDELTTDQLILYYPELVPL